MGCDSIVVGEGGIPRDTQGYPPIPAPAAAAHFRRSSSLSLSSLVIKGAEIYESAPPRARDEARRARERGWMNRRDPSSTRERGYV